MSRNKNKRASVNTRSSKISSTTPTKRGRRKMQPKPPSMTVVKLPSIFRTTPDTFAIRLRTVSNIVNSASNFSSTIVALAPGSITTANYAGLGDFFPLLSGLTSQYTKFMVSRLSVQLVPTTPATSGGYVALGYEPDDTNTSGPATVLSDVTSSLHSDVAQVTEIASIEVNPAMYFNEWRQCTPTTGTSTFEGQAGVVQLWCSNAAATAVGVALLELEVDIHFCGYRKT